MPGWRWAVLPEHIPYTAIILNMLTGDGRLTVQVFLYDLVIGHLGSQVFCCDCQRWQKVRQGACLGNAKFLFHSQDGMASE